MRLFLARHSESSGNDAGLVRGVSPYGLGSQGVMLAWRQASWIARNLPHVDIFSSHVQRAMDTAGIVAEAQGAKVFPVRALSTWDMGDLAGLPESVAQPEVEYFLDHPSEPIPGGESHNHFSGRLIRALAALRAYSASRNCLAETHAKCFAVIDNVLNGRPATYRVAGKWPVTAVAEVTPRGLKVLYAPAQPELTLIPQGDRYATASASINVNG